VIHKLVCERTCDPRDLICLNYNYKNAFCCIRSVKIKLNLQLLYCFSQASSTSNNTKFSTWRVVARPRSSRGGACPAHTRGLPCFRKFHRGRHVNLYRFLAAATSVRGWHVNLILLRLVQLFKITLPMRTRAAVRSSRVPRLSLLMRGTNETY